MTIHRYFFLALVGSLSCPAQEPSMAGTWQMARQTLGSRVEDSVRFPEEVSSDIQPIHFLANGSFSVGPDSGTWLFSRDYLLAVQPGGVNSVAVNTTGDTFIFAEAESKDLGDGISTNQGRFAVVVKEPMTPTTTSQVLGGWVLFQQELEYRDSPSGGTTMRTLREVSQSRTNLTLNSGGTFNAVTVIDTNDPGDVGTVISGTWLMSGGAFEATVGPEVVTRTGFSSGKDLLVHVEEGSAMDGSDTLGSARMDVWVKKASTLTVPDLVGCWGLAGTTIDLEVDAGGGGQSLGMIGFEESVLEFRSDGTGTRRVVDNREAAVIGLSEDFVWTLDGNEIVMTTTEGAFQFVVSAQKDTALMQQFEADIANERESFDFFAMVKLPDAPGFGGMPMDIALVDVGSDRKAVLTTPTVVGLRYQVEVSENLTGWQSLGPIMMGTGGMISSNLPALPSEASYFRWRILPPAL